MSTALPPTVSRSAAFANQPTNVSLPKSLLLAILVPFTALTAVALWQVGLLGIFVPHFTTWGGAQVFADLVIALCFCMVWMWRDAKRTGRKAWFWVVFTLLAGSFSPLLYWLTRGSGAD
jgi:uncharacterized membrane protein